MFIGPRITTVFASRWKALAWSAGVLMTAWCSVPSPDQDDGNTAAAQAGSHASPWAISSPAPAR